MLNIYLIILYLKSKNIFLGKGTISSGNEEDEIIKTNYIVNAAGCNADKIAKLLGDDFFNIKPRRGDYILFNKKEGKKINHTIFPVPHPYFGKGVLVQNTLWGNLIIGPTSRDLLRFNKKKGEWENNIKEYGRTNVEILSELLFKARRVIPNLDTKKIIHTFSGDRAKSTCNDWIIKTSSNTLKIIHVAGIDSPGIAASPAIALEIISLLKKAKAPILDLYASFNPYRAPIIVPKLTNLSGLKSLKIGENGKYRNPEQNVVCKCENVTESEIIDACHRSLPIDSTQSIRKRTRAGMGHCQASPDNYNCETRIKDIIQRETGQKNIGKRQWPGSSLLSHRWFLKVSKKSFVRLTNS